MSESHLALRFALSPVFMSTDEICPVRYDSLVFWLGDLNYRIDLGISEIKRLVRKKQFALLLKYDQVSANRSLVSLETK